MALFLAQLGMGKGRGQVVAAGGPPAANILNWPLNETSGTTITATVGQNGTTNGTWSTGNVLNGSTQHSETASNQAFGVQVITVACWINCGWASYAGGTAHILWESGPNVNGGAASTFNALIDVPNAIVGINLNDATGAGQYVAHISLPASGQRYLVVVYNNTNGSTKAYIDGLPVTVTVDFSIWATAGNWATAAINMGAQNAGSTFFTAGTFRNFRIWNSELTSGDIASLFALGPQ